MLQVTVLQYLNVCVKLQYCTVLNVVCVSLKKNIYVQLNFLIKASLFLRLYKEKYRSDIHIASMYLNK